MALDTTPDARPTLPQEIIDLILDFADKATLINCSLVARSFVPTSQKHIFSRIWIVPSQRLSFRSSPPRSLRGLHRILAKSPHIASYVRALSIVEGDGTVFKAWIRDDTVPTVISKLSNMTELAITSQVLLDWTSLPASLKSSCCSPALTCIRLDKVHFRGSAELGFLLQGCRNLQFVDLRSVAVEVIDDEHLAIPSQQLGLCSLDLMAVTSTLTHSILRYTNLQKLLHLHTSPGTPENEVHAQRILDATCVLEHYHIQLSHHHTETSTIDIHELRNLLALEITVSFDFASARDEYDPVRWISDILSRVSEPSLIRDVVLNIHIEEQDLTCLGRLAPLEPLLLRSEMASLQRLLVRLDSFTLDFSICGAERDILDAFPAFQGVLEIVLVGIN